MAEGHRLHWILVMWPHRAVFSCCPSPAWKGLEPGARLLGAPSHGKCWFLPETQLYPWKD